ncbi:hypothetical protein KXW28_004683 [Aspergillus fumigatus]|nr:hypothetical protein KXX45_002989 [Aspergillus fumigatus]KAH1345954.1 hypothetical protein KXX14_004674 [Aspergillus fumigatus]KAH1688644.1 hypothetical protein KXX23_003893 [Aspergillus fumigatus]KAH1692752.1 hypothetical protein KXX24_003547 [Aspergillus fumigatus]KAH1713881.1 hypothetical protein KXX40_004720 [Aspergillus fumigatus]
MTLEGKGICSGKHAIADYLIEHQEFKLLELNNKHYPRITDDPEDDLRLQASELSNKRNSEFTFDSVESLLDFATKRWKERWVTTDILDTATIERFLQRPFFLLVSVDAPVSLRWKRFTDRCRRRQLDPPPLERFVIWNDRHLYDKDIGRAYLTDRAQVRLFNSCSSLEELHVALEALNLADERRLRPNWDLYFMQLASLAAQRSNCMKRRARDATVEKEEVLAYRHVFAFMRKRTLCWKQAESVYAKAQYSIAIRQIPRPLLAAFQMLMTRRCPCLTCTVKIAQVGISEVVYSQGYNMDQESAAILKAAGVCLRQFSPPRNGLIYLQNSQTISSDLPLISLSGGNDVS